MQSPNDTEYLGISGAGGGGDTGSSSASVYTNTPDTLRSTDSFEILLGLGSGRWKGLTNGLKSLYINDVPLENTDGSSNFKDVTAIFADGDPAQTQTVTFKLGGGGGITGVNTVLANPNTGGVPGNWVSGATTVPNADFLDFRFLFNQLYHSSPDGIFEATAVIELQMRVQGSSTWVNPLITPAVPSTYNATDSSLGLQTFIQIAAEAMVDQAGGTDTTPSSTPYYPTDGDGGGTYTVYRPSWKFVDSDAVARPDFESDLPEMKGRLFPSGVDIGDGSEYTGGLGIAGGGGGTTTIPPTTTNPDDYGSPPTTPPPSTPPGTSNYLNITGKTMSPFVKELRLAVPKGGAYANKTWEFRARLVSQDHQYLNVGTDNQEEFVRSVSLESVTSVIKSVLGYDPAWKGLVWMQIFGQASEQLSGFPALKGIYDTKIVKVPNSSVYNPATRQYTGTIWDGTYTSQYTNDPAWCIKDIIEDSVSGIAAISPGATLDKWDALDASKYFSQLVPDGRGGTQPRFSMNFRLESETNAEQLIQYMAGAVNSLCVDTGGGVWRMKVDKPETPVATFTVDNIFGDFQYSHTDIDTRFNDITITFVNEELNYTEDRLRVYDSAHIARYGRKPTTIVAVGCTNRQEALRRAVLRLRTSLNEIKIVKFTTNRQGKLLEPLQTIYVADQSLGYTPPTGSGALSDADPYNNRTTSRISSLNAARDQITLGSTIRLESNVTYKIEVTVPNTTYNPAATTQPASADWRSPTVVIERTLTNTTAQRGDVTVLYLDSALPTNTPPNAVVALSATGMPTLPVKYRIIDLQPSDNEMVGVTAIIIDSGKYAAADAAASTDVKAWVYTGRSGGSSGGTTGTGGSGSGGTGDGTNYTIARPTVPTWGMFTLSAYRVAGVERRILTVNWVKPTGNSMVTKYTVFHQAGRGHFEQIGGTSSQTSIELQDPVPGRHNFRVIASDAAGGRSQPLIGGYDVPPYNTGVGIPHSYGNFTDRPSTSLVSGQLYTALDKTPVITYRWSGTAWVITSSAGSDVHGGGSWGGTGSIGIVDSGDVVTPTRRMTRDELRTILGTSAAITGQGALATKNQAAWSGDVSGRPANLAALTGLEFIDNSLLKAALTDDNILQISEKMGALNVRNAQLESAYSSSVTRATELGLTTTALNTARTNWLTLLDSYDNDKLLDYPQAWDFVNNEYWAGGSQLSSMAALPGYSYTRTGIETLIDTDGTVLTFAANVVPITQQGVVLHGPLTNILLNAGSASNLATQSVTTTATAYVLAFVGTGTVTLSGTATGAIVGTSDTQQTVYNFTPTAGTLTLTVTGTVQYAVLYAASALAAPVPIIATTGATAALGASALNSNSLMPDGATVLPAQDWSLELVADITVVGVSNSLIVLGNTGNSNGYATIQINSSGQFRLLGVGNSLVGTVTGIAPTVGRVAVVLRRVGGHYYLTVRQAAGEGTSGPSVSNDTPTDGYNRIFFGGYGGGARPNTSIRYVGFKLGTLSTVDASARALALYNDIIPPTGRADAWNSFNADTTIYTPAFGDENFPTSWTLDNVAPTNKRVPYWNLADTTRIVAARVYRDLTIGGEQKVTAGLVVKKGSAASNSNPSLQLKTLGGAIQKASQVQFDLSTGSSASTGTTLDDFGVLDLGDDWLVWATITGYVDSTGVRLEVYPVWSQNLANASDVTLRGNININGAPLLAKGDWTSLGKNMMTARYRDYANTSNATIAAISRKDYGADINGTSLFDSASGTPTVPMTRAEVRTSLGTAAAITGQGTLATKNSAALDTDVTDGTTYKRYAATEQTKLSGVAAGATVGARAGTNIFRTDGTTVMTQAEVRTAEGVAASITGQGTLATKNTATATLITARERSNLYEDSEFDDPTYQPLATGWAYTTETLVTDPTKLNANNGIKTVVGNGTLTQPQTVSDIPFAYMPRVSAGQRYRFEIGVGVKAAFSGKLQYNLTWYKADGTPSASGALTVYSTDYTSVAAAADAFQTLSVEGNAPSDANRVRVRLSVIWSTTINSAQYGIFVRPRIIKLSRAGTNGDIRLEDDSPATDALIKTSLGTAASITGQGALATKSTAALDTDVTDGTTYKRYAATEQTKLSGVAAGATVGARAGTNIFQTDGTTVMSQADIRTAEGVAASITGQGALATKSTAALDTDVTDGTTYKRYAATEQTKLSGVAAGATVGGTFGVDLLEVAAGAVATLSNFKTASGTAAGIAGQGALATKSAVDLTTGDVTNKSLANLDSTASTKLGGIAAGATVGSRAGTNMYQTDGTTVMSQADVRTVEGVASAVTGQGLWATYTTLTPTTISNRTQNLNSSGRINDVSGLQANRSYGLRSLNDAVVFTDTWVAGTPNTVTINIAAMNLYSDAGDTLALPSGTVTGCTPATKYYIYRNMTNPQSATGSYGASVNLIDALSATKVYLGFWTTRASSGASGGGGGYGGSDCVAVEAYVLTSDGPLPSLDASKGVMLSVLDEDSMAWSLLHPVEINRVGYNDCVTIKTESGIELTLSLNTPITLRDGGHTIAANSWGHEVPVRDVNGFRWEKIVDVSAAGYRAVSKITCGQKTYAAGNKAGAYIYTHNVQPLKL